MTLAAELLLGAGLGLSLAVPPGPMNAWIAAAASRSYRAGVATGCGAMTADGILGAVVFLLYRNVDLAAGLPLIYGLGAGVLGFFAYRLLRTDARAEPPDREVPSFVQALGLGLTNPFQVLWWLTAGIGSAYAGGLPLLLALFGAIAVWVVAFPWAIHLGVRRSPKVERAVRLGSAVALAAFGAYFLVLAVLAV